MSMEGYVCIFKVGKFYRIGYMSSTDLAEADLTPGDAVNVMQRNFVMDPDLMTKPSKQCDYDPQDAIECIHLACYPDMESFVDSLEDRWKHFRVHRSHFLYKRWRSLSRGEWYELSHPAARAVAEGNLLLKGFKRTAQIDGLEITL